MRRVSGSLIFDQLTGLLRRLVREDEGRDARPSACLLDSQTVKTSADVHLADQGFVAAQPAPLLQAQRRTMHVRTTTRDEPSRDGKGLNR
jgi:hypothetical protein